MIRYVILKEETCTVCNGDGWRITEDDDDLCPECDGLGHTMEEVAIADSLEEMKALLPEQSTPNPHPFSGCAAYPVEGVSNEA